MRTSLLRSCLALSLTALLGLSLGCSSEKTPDANLAEAHADKAVNAAGHDKIETKTAEVSEEDLLNKADPKGKYGNGLTLAAQTELTSILADPESYEGKMVQVQGVVAEVCPKRGCWIELKEPRTSETIRVKVTDGDIVFPLSAKDEPAVVEGTIERIELDEEDNRNWQEHLAEERGETFDRESVQGPSVIWRIRGEGAEIGV